ncbi:MAG: RNA polymerase sigma factor, partial [Bacteroidia bacterium]
TELRRNHYRENGQFTGWLNKIAYNVAMDILNCEKYYVHEPEEAMPEQSVTPAEGPDDREWAIRQVFKKMHITMKRVVYFYFKKKMSCRQIAEKINSTPGAVSKTLCRAYIMIRKELAKMNPGKYREEKLFIKSAVKNRASRIV